MGAKTKIDWADATWSPVTGCLHGCKYCYARKIAERFGGFEPRCGREDISEDKRKYGKNSIWNNTHGETLHVFSKHPMRRTAKGEWQKANYPYNFEPTFHRYKLDEPQKWKKGRNIFVCSMADLFGEWVPDEWIEEVLAACEKAPQHNYLFLTKNPKRYEKVLNTYMPDNMWFGWSQTGPTEDRLTFSTHHSVQTFVSIEPLSKPFDKFIPQGIGWVIIGAETGNRKGKVIPKREWIENIVNECMKADIPVFMKESLADIWGEPLIQEYPEGLRKERGNERN